jgi:C4-dicarboxylate-binding protein DctP
VFCDALARITNGDIEIQFTQNIVEGGRKASDLLSDTESGELDGCYFSSSYLAGRVPELALFDQHFAVPDRRRAYGVLDGSLGARLADEVAKATGFRVMGYWDNGLRHISSASTAFRSPADCKGMKIRTLASDDHQRVFRALGFSPLAIDVRDLPAAVAQGTVDAQENPLTNIYNFNLHKTHRVITLTGHLMGVAPVLFNQASFDSWSDDVKNSVTEALEEATQAQRGFAEDDDDVCSSALEAEGVTLVNLTADERASLIDAVRGEVEVTCSRFDQELIDLFESDLGRVPA